MEIKSLYRSFYQEDHLLAIKEEDIHPQEDDLLSEALLLTETDHRFAEEAPLTDVVHHHEDHPREEDLALGPQCDAIQGLSLVHQKETRAFHDQEANPRVGQDLDLNNETIFIFCVSCWA